MLKNIQRVYAQSVGDLEIAVFRTLSRTRRYQIIQGSRVLARTDTEDKARMFVDAYCDGWCDRGEHDYRKYRKERIKARSEI